jgi:hypothetical protein
MTTSSTQRAGSRTHTTTDWWDLILTSQDHKKTGTTSSTSNMTLLEITNESRSPITHEKTETLFKEVLWRSLGNLFNHCLEFYLDIRGFFSQRIHSTTQLGDQGVYPKQGMFFHPYFSAVRPVLARPR